MHAHVLHVLGLAFDRLNWCLCINYILNTVMQLYWLVVSGVSTGGVFIVTSVKEKQQHSMAFSLL